MNRGFEEAQAAFSTAPSGLVGEVRRFGPFGPAYEVLELISSREVVIGVIESGETLTYAVSDLRADPVAVTIP